MRVHLQALGCRLNEAELEAWSRQLQALGHQLVARPEQADLLVVNTCAVTEEAVRKSRKLLRRSHRESPHAKLVVSGCYASLDPAGVAAGLGIDLLVPNRDKGHLVEIAVRELDLATMPVSASEPDALPLPWAGRQRAFIKVQDGCRHRCTFCIVTQARGAEHSRPPAEVIAEVNRLHGQGVQEVVLSGVHIAGYGSDLGLDLADLLRGLLAETGVPRIRIGSLEPWGLPKGFWDLFADPRLQPHLHLPVQSGSDRVLRRMGRRCKRAQFLRLVEEGRRRVPDLNVTTDIIVGFPGENAADWGETLDLAQRAGFGHIHIFPYSPRRGTLAAAMPEQVPDAVRRTRCGELHALAADLRRATLERCLGRALPVLLEQPDPDRGCWMGHTPNYMQVRLPAPGGALLANRIVQCTLIGVTEDGDGLLAAPLPGV
jgi:threonylcarbamoyladenosine tRNA methylthiotransferase MtaB